MTFSKLCPKCGKIQSYQRKNAFVFASKMNKQCVDCGHKVVAEKLRVVNKGKTHSVISRNKMSKFRRGMPKSVEWKEQQAERMKGNSFGKRNAGRPFTEEHKEKLRKPKSEEARQNMRLAAIRRIERNCGVVVPNHNPIACEAIDEYGKKHNYNFQHAENGGEFYIKELGYWVDGYDVKNNVVIEYDEPYHQTLNQQEKDKRRQQQIIDKLQCTFIRIVQLQKGEE